MSRGKDAPIGFECPYRHNCPHLDTMSTAWVMEVYQEASELRERLYAMEQQYEQRIAELQKALLERDEKIADCVGSSVSRRRLSRTWRVVAISV